MDKTWNNKAWFMVLPVLVLVAFNAIIPLMTVVNYSVQDTFGNNVFFWSGVGWFEEVLHSERFHAALLRAADSSPSSSSLIEIPLGIAIALDMPRKRPLGLGLPRADGAAAAHPVERRRHHLEHLRRCPTSACSASARTRSASTTTTRANPIDAWFTLILMDVWHWTSLVVLLCYAGLVSIPDAYYQAAKIDGASRWAVFRYIQLPKMKRVLTIAILLRFMDAS